MVWFYGPILPYLANKFLLVFRDRIVPTDAVTIVFGVLGIAWCIFGLVWLIWILFSNETRFMKACTIVFILAVFVASITLNFQASNGTIGDIQFP